MDNADGWRMMQHQDSRRESNKSFGLAMVAAGFAAQCVAGSGQAAAQAFEHVVQLTEDNMHEAGKHHISGPGRSERSIPGLGRSVRWPPGALPIGALPTRS